MNKKLVLIFILAYSGVLNAQTNTFPTTGNVGIGTTAPVQALHISGGSIRIDNAAKTNAAGISVTSIQGSPYAELNLFGGAGTGLFVRNDGNVGIGTTNPIEKLSVNGNIRTKKVIVTQTSWSDYVFDSSYHFKTLDEVEVFIKQNKHLPDIPSVKEVAENGIDLGDSQALLLKKIEELTLYIIEVNKKNRELQTELKKQGNEIQSLKKQIKKMKY